MICYHRWKTLKREPTVRVEQRMRTRYCLGGWPGEEFPEHVEHRVCEKCGYVDDQIAGCEIVLKARQVNRESPKYTVLANLCDLLDVLCGG